MSAEKKEKLTPEQAAAVKYRGGALLVSAAAGSGKTKVLVERLLERVLEGEADIDKFLVITYTRAAATELREKILDEITKRLALEPDNRRLYRQSVLCHGAPISTIHSFCTDILRECPHEIEGLTPDFRVADESECSIMKLSVLEDVLNDAYETIDTHPGFRELANAATAGRDDTRLAAIILDTHAKLQSSPDPEKWILEQSRRLTPSEQSDASETIWGAYLMSNAKLTADFWLSEMRGAREEMRQLEKLEAAYGAAYDAVIDLLKKLSCALGRNWDESRTCAQAAAEGFIRPRGISGFEEFKDLRTRCKAAIIKLASVFECSSAELFEDMAAVAPALIELMRIITVFDRAYAYEKRKRGIVDFSDLEHLTLSLLIDRETGEKTEFSRIISDRYTEIMVDEYQDVNAVQEQIFGAVSREGTNIFMVGDVKQSIYRFRLADPSIFLGKYMSFCDAGGDGCENGARILLQKNFRSRAGVLEAVNYVFERIMSPEFGEMEYTKREYLYPGRPDAQEGDSPALELNIVDMSTIERAEDEDSPAKAEAEAGFIARRIFELIDKGEIIPDGEGGKRRAEYSDIVILLRSVRDKAWRYAKALSELGIPADIPGGEEFLGSAEILAAISLLSVIDNPIQDIPLAAAMQSPVYRFTADELAVIRAGSKDTDFYTALNKAAQSDEKCASFLKDLESLRTVAPDMPSDRFIWHVYNKTGMLAAYSAMRGGARRRGNLIKLTEYARGFENSGYKGLFGFLTYVRGLMERGEDLAPLPGETGENAVRIMSIHKSKGLEFPIVIIADTSKKLNNRDSLKPLVVHPQLGTGLSRTDRVRRIEYPTLSRLAVQRKLTLEMMAEELRVLYVAMTRAREKLIISAAFKDAGKELEKLKKLTRPGKIPARLLEETRSMAGWLLLPALNRREAAYLTQGGEPQSTADGWDIRVIKLGKEKQENVRALRIEERETGTEEFRVLYEKLSYKYPHRRAAELPSKLTVTELKGRFTDHEAAQEALNAAEGTDGENGRSRKPRFTFERPGFITDKGVLTPSERGTALHLAMQYIDYSRAGSVQGVLCELERLVKMKFLKKEQAQAVNPDKITAFFQSDIGKRVLKAHSVTREFKFSLLSPASDFFPDGGADNVLFQGVIDCFFEEEEGALTVVDFKTDRVTKDTLSQKVMQYSPQLEAYSHALVRITKKQVKERIIYFFSEDRAVYL